MYRMTSWLVALAVSLGACASAPREEVQDPPLVERLRLSITKTRNAIRETRLTIARSQGSPHLPELYVRLAELISEEARYHNQVAYEREERKSRLIHAPQVQLLKNQAIAVYREVLERFPDTPLAPQVLFNIGHELRELGEFEDMVKTLEELVQRYPASPLTDEALLVLGDYYFDKSELEPAGAKYAAITTRPASRVTSLAQYKLAWVHVNLGACNPALTAFEAALDASAAWAEKAATRPTTDDRPAGAQSIDVRREALVDLVYCYTQEREVTEAVPYLRQRAANRAAYIAALRRMADRLSLMNRPDAGLPVARALLSLAPGDQDRLDDARVLFTFLRHELGPERDRFLFKASDVRMLTEAVLRWAQLPGGTDELRASTRDEFERYARDILTTAQERAQGMPEGELRAAALSEVADGYIVYLDAFPQAAERLAMVKNLVDTAGLAGRHAEAGLFAIDASEAETEAKARQAALLDAVSELQKALEDRAGGSEHFVARAALRKAGLALLTPSDVPLPSDKMRTVKFAVGLTYFDEGRFREAIDRFTALAYEYPGTEEGSTALFLALDAYEAEGDYDGLIGLGHRFLEPDSPANEAARAKIAPAVARAEQRKLDELALAAAGTGGSDLAELERFGQRFAGTKLGERALVNAFVAARALGDGDAVQRLGRDIVQKYPGSDQAVGIITTMARSALASLDYDRAIQAFGEAAATQTGDTVPLLMAAADIQAELGDIAAAERLLSQALGAAKTPAARAQIGGRMAVLLEARGAGPDEVLRVLTPLVADKEPRVLAAVGLAQVATGRPELAEQAETTFQAVLGGQTEAGVDAKARAHLGSAEALARLIEGFQTEASLDSLNELTALVDLLEESYLTAARAGDAFVTPTALGRLAASARLAANKLRQAPMPSEVSEADRQAIKQGLAARATQLEELGAGAITTCAAQAFASKIFNPAMRKCLAGQALSDARLEHDRVKPRQRSGASPVPEVLRSKLSENPEDVATIIAVGEALLDAGDPHTARLVLGRAADAGNPIATDPIGVAHHQVGDVTGALEAFARAADAGLEAGRQNLRAVFTAIGLTAAADEVGKRWPDAGDPGGRLIGGGAR